MNAQLYNEIVAKLIILAKAEADGYELALKDTKHLRTMTTLINKINELDDDRLKVIAVATNLRLVADKERKDIDKYYQLHNQMVDALLEELNNKNPKLT